MAWTTSACLRAWPIAGELLAAQMKKARFVAASTRRVLWRTRSVSPIAISLCALGLAAPLLPPQLIAFLLLASAAALIVAALRSQPGRNAALAIRLQPSAAEEIPVAEATSASQRQALPIGFQVTGMRRNGATPAMRRTRFATELKERSWADLMARVNHDLRTPLNAVIGFSELMTLELFGPLGDQRYQDYAQHIRDSASDLLKSAEDTLALTALMASPAHREAVCACDLQGLANDAWSFLARKAAARAIEIDASIPADLEVLGEPRVLRQVLVNMLSEGINRAANGERVILAAVTEGELIELTLSVSRERARSSRRSGALPICLARTLLEMQGSSLLELNGAAQGWRAVTVLDRALQPDFFMDPGRENESRPQNDELVPATLFG
jgi:signal transduction histidine kinase